MRQTFWLVWIVVIGHNFIFNAHLVLIVIVIVVLLNVVPWPFQVLRFVWANSKLFILVWVNYSCSKLKFGVSFLSDLLFVWLAVPLFLICLWLLRVDGVFISLEIVRIRSIVLAWTSLDVVVDCTTCQVVIGGHWVLAWVVITFKHCAILILLFCFVNLHYLFLNRTNHQFKKNGMWKKLTS